MQPERVVIREKTLKYWLVGGPVIAPGADRFWKLHGYTRRRRRVLHSTLMVLLVGGPLFFLLFGRVGVGLLRSGGTTEWFPLVALVGWGLVRLAFLPINLYFVWLAWVVRRAQGMACWECGAALQGNEGACNCGERWNTGALRQFWVACGLLPAPVREVREARFALGGAMVQPKAGWIARLTSGLPQDQMSAWQERPLTQQWLKQAMKGSAMIILAASGALMGGTVFIAVTFVRSGMWVVLIGMAMLGAAAIASQFCIVRWGLRRAVRRARERVREADGLICTDCGFVLSGLAEKDRCPECGIEFRAEEVKAFFRACGVME